MNRLGLLFLSGSAFFSGGLFAEPRFTPNGDLARPTDYREWVFLTSGLGMTYDEGTAAKQDREMRFDNVFAEPRAYKQFMSTGSWPDKIVFVTEVRKSEVKGSINVGGRFQTSLAALEVAVKDTARFKGDGWGYFFFSPTATSAKRIGPEGGCNACHSKNAAVDNTFVQFYPTLLEVAKAKGVLKPSYTGTAGH
jgi:hypothetical protein